MLGKLLKYDLLYGYKTFVICIVATLLFGLTMEGFVLQNSFSGPFGQIFRLLITTGLPLGIAITATVLIIRSYHQALFNSQGYLTMTLPVKPANILLSKTLVAVIWVNLIGAAALISIATMQGWNLERFANTEYAFIVLTLNLLLFNVLQGVYTAISAGFVAFRKIPRWISTSIVIGGIVIVQGFAFFGLSRLLDGRFIGSLNGTHGIYRWSDANWYNIRNPGLLSIWDELIFYADLNMIINTAVFGMGLFFLNHWLVKRKVNLD